MKANKFVEKAKSKKMLETTSDAVISAQNVPVIVENDLDRITREIRADLQKMDAILGWVSEKKKQFAETRERVLKNLIHVKENRKQLLGEKTFEVYLESDIGITKGYFYQVLRAYEIAQDYKKPELFENVDYRILSDISRIDDEKIKKDLLRRAESLTRDEVKQAAHKEADDLKPKKVKSIAEVNSTRLTIKLPNADVLKEIELLLKKRGIEIQYK